MQRDVNVNTGDASGAENAGFEDFEEWPNDEPDPEPLPLATAADQGPCLYMGPEGQRCDRRAVEGGYCERHRPGGAAGNIPPTARIIATIGLLVILWPYFADLVREILRWMHSQ